MTNEDNINVVKGFFVAMGSGDLQNLRARCVEDVKWFIPGDWALTGAHRGHGGVEALLQTASRAVETTIAEPMEFVAQGDRVLVIGSATGTIKATNKKFEDDFIFAFTVRNGKITTIREYNDTLALARASDTPAETVSSGQLRAGQGTSR